MLKTPICCFKLLNQIYSNLPNRNHCWCSYVILLNYDYFNIFLFCKMILLQKLCYYQNHIYLQYQLQLSNHFHSAVSLHCCQC